MRPFRTLDDLDFGGKTVLVRGDLNVPVKDGIVTDSTRIDRLAPTLAAIARQGAKVVVMSHFGRPKGGADPAMSLRQVLPALEGAVGHSVIFSEDCIGPRARVAIGQCKRGQTVLLENLRFHAGEEANDEEFADALAELGDIYVNDAFSAAHRAHASTEGLAHLLPSAAGLLMQAEIEALSKALEEPARPVLAVVGGAKISTKLDLLQNLVRKVDVLVLGGGMANTVLAARGIAVGASLHEASMGGQARTIMEVAEAAGCEMILPSDAVVAAALEAGVETTVVPVDGVPPHLMMLDVGPETVTAICDRLGGCKTVIWNGPLGAFETAPFEAGTVAVARRVAELTEAGRVLSVAGGGDTVAALGAAGVVDRFSYVSTAGGAFLEWMEGRDLPGVAALRSRT